MKSGNTNQNAGKHNTSDNSKKFIQTTMKQKAELNRKSNTTQSSKDEEYSKLYKDKPKDYVYFDRIMKSSNNGNIISNTRIARNKIISNERYDIYVQDANVEDMQEIKNQLGINADVLVHSKDGRVYVTVKSEDDFNNLLYIKYVEVNGKQYELIDENSTKWLANSVRKSVAYVSSLWN